MGSSIGFLSLLGAHLEAHDVIQRCGHTTAASGVGAQRKADLSRNVSDRQSTVVVISL